MIAVSFLFELLISTVQWFAC